MKRTIIVLLIALSAAGAAFGQGYGPAFNPALAQAPAQELVKIEGKLTLVQGYPAIVVKDKTYFVRIPQLMYGYVEGLGDGSLVKLEGYEQAVPFAANSFFFMATKLTFNGKDYDLSQHQNHGRMGMAGGAQGGTAMGGMMGGGRGGRR